MANWLLDYMEMTEYIPIEFRDQSFLMRELDLKVSNKMSQLEVEIQNFFSIIEKLNNEERQERYNALLAKCNEATEAATDKIRLADQLHDLVEKSMRLLDQGLEKLKEDLIDGDKAYIVEDIERRSRELEEQLRDDHLQTSDCQKAKNSKSSHAIMNCNNLTSNQHTNHRRSTLNPSSLHQYHAKYQQRRSRHSSTSMAPSSINPRIKKRERKRLNNMMTIFNRNSSIRIDEDSTDRALLSPSSTPEYPISIHNPSLNNVSGGDEKFFGIRDKFAGIRNPVCGNGDKTSGRATISAKARQPILSAIDAALAVSPGATNSDKLILLSGCTNGDNDRGSNKYSTNPGNTTHVNTNSNWMQRFNSNHQSITHQLGNHLALELTDCKISRSQPRSFNGGAEHPNLGHVPFRHHSEKKPSALGRLPLSCSQNDEILLAASQAINATQSMTSGRRTSSLKASYAAVNSTPGKNPPIASSTPDQHVFTGNVYCKCRGTKHDPNMIGCDNPNCKIEWFHYECVGITTPPDGEWYCDDCRASKGSTISNYKRSNIKSGSLSTSDKIHMASNQSSTMVKEAT